jgi:flagellar assembly factor FliW
LPGFESQTRFLLVQRAPLVALQSIDTPDLCFLAMPVEAIQRDYQLAMTPEDQRALSLTTPPLSLAILSATEAGNWTANLLAPVVINPETRCALQAVRADSLYSHQHPLPAGDARCS